MVEIDSKLYTDQHRPDDYYDPGSNDITIARRCCDPVVKFRQVCIYFFISREKPHESLNSRDP